VSQWASKTVDELKQELGSRGMPVSGKKSELVKRLELAGLDSAVLEAEIAAEDAKVFPSMVVNRLKESSQAAILRLKGLPVATMVVAVLLVVGMTGGALLYSDDFVEWIQGEPDYALIDFDSNQTRAYAEGLVSLGHPEWGGRLSGTEEEKNTAQSIKLNFSSSGMPVTLEEFEVPLFYMGNEFEIMICTPGNIGNIFGGPAPCSVADIDRDETEFIHREDYVVQGYSGDVDIVASSDVNVIDLEMGNESSDWGSAANGIGLVWIMDGQDGDPGTESNTVLLLRAQENSLRGLITVNAKQNCDELVSGDCVPYFKSVDITQFDEKPYDIGFVMVSKSLGEMIAEQVVEGESMLQFVIEVDNQVNVNVHVPCGIIEGKSDSLIIIGAHHDTVYNGQGAVDNTAGTATVQEIARQFGLLQSELGQPKHTIYFCTWGGEEEGLWGSSEWVKKHQDTLKENLRLYVNLDMNHVDAQRNSGLTLQGNSPADVKHIVGLVSAFAKSYPDLASKYEINVRHLDSEQMPYNSDHAPFVYNLDESGGGDNHYGKAVMCYGSGSEEYHTYLDNMDRFNEESLIISGIVYGSLVRYLAWG
jgi:hypothetical protein